MNVNSDVKTTIDTADYVMQFLMNTWTVFPVELKVYVLTMFVISLLMQWYKKALLNGKTTRQKRARLWLISLPLGCLLALGGWHLTRGYIHDGYWALIGLTVGMVAMGVHYVSIDIIWPLVRTLPSRARAFMSPPPKDHK